MKIARLVGVLLVAIFAMSAIAASTAAASEPEFSVLPATKTFTSTSGAGTLKAGTVATTTCTADTNKGTITGMKTVGSVVVTFTGCKISGNSKVCTVKSVGSTEGTIVTNTLKGELGTAKGSTSGVGLLLEPASGGVFVTLAETSCGIETSVEGGIVGEITPVKSSQTTGKIIYALLAGKQGLKELTVAGATKTKVLKAFGLVEVVEETSDLLEFAGKTEVS
jgi:hypothetical protein